jgi:fido (protein-threonine AMPylation protein)
VEAATGERPLTEMFIRQVHKIMLRTDYIPEGKNYTVHAGIYKTRPNSVQTPTGEIFEYASPEETPALMMDLIAWYNNVEKEAKRSPLEIAALFHYRYIRIHPFEDGNGRIARLLVNYILAKHGYPMIVVHDSDRNGYLGALGQCDANTGLVPAMGAHAGLEQITPLVDYLEQCLKRALIISIKAAKGENIEEDDDLQKRLAILARNAQAKRGDIKRRSDEYVAEIIDGFIAPFKDEINTQLAMFSNFYNKIDVSFYYVGFGGGKVSLTQKVLDARRGNFEKISSRMVIEVLLTKPTILLPTNSAESIKIYIGCNDEEYNIQLFDETQSFRYGVLPTDSQQKAWIKKIMEYLYASIEKKVAEIK